MIRRFAVLGLVTAVCTLSACTSSGGNAKKTASPTPTPTSASSSAPATVIQPKKLPTFGNSVPLRSKVTKTSCTSTSTGWQAGGTATSGTNFSYAIGIYFTNDKGTVVSYGKTTVAVKAGKTAPWTVKATFKAPANVQCVLVGVAKA